MLGTKQPSGNVDDIFARLRPLPRQSCTQQFSCFFLERAPVFGRARSQPVVQGLVNIPNEQTDHGTAAFRVLLANASKPFCGRQLGDPGGIPSGPGGGLAFGTDAGICI
jgi:hypothetical protein